MRTDLETDDLIRLIDALNPANEPGRLTLICRMGSDKVREGLAPLIRAVEEGRPIGCLVLRSDARQRDHLVHRV